VGAVVSAGAVAEAALDRVSVHDVAHHDQDAHPHRGADDAGGAPDLEDVAVQIPATRDHAVEPAPLLGIGVAPVRAVVHSHADDPAHATVGAAVTDGLPRPAPDRHGVASGAAKVSSRTNSIAPSGTVSGPAYAGTPSLTG
jgi:hypothetical protein